MKWFKKPRPISISWKGQKMLLKCDLVDTKEAFRVAHWFAKVAFYKEQEEKHANLASKTRKR